MLQLISDKYFDDYLKQVNQNLMDALPIGETPVYAPDSFSFYTSVASVYSSKIEGEAIDADSYLKHRYMGVKFKPDYTKKIDDLFNAYAFARDKPLTIENLMKAHTLLTKNILRSVQRGKVRTGVIYVTDENERIMYVGANPSTVRHELDKLLGDISFLLTQELTVHQAFYYAAYIHLLFLNIHPFDDGNGRSARLLEKWFLAQILGEKAWFIPSEKYYYRHLADYYKNLQRLGLEYESLNDDNALPFLLMLAESLA